MRLERSINEILKSEQDIVTDLLVFYDDGKDYSKIIYTDWSAKDVLGHILSWHESFARNVSDIVEDRKPNPLKGSLYEVNENGVRQFKETPIRELSQRLIEAQKIINENILNKKIELIPYKKGSRSYSPQEHLEVVYKHIKNHLTDLNKAYK
ncbi:hypothetical protein [Breznakiella homolactica]|uniref:DinB family protein n=1 Tax=Breznakiella homolactica TaxID=2798577 RepID=A0A7T7XPZ4_9SPIR|nr:hypothetical protein [Breznakiella homolactica]QQO10361.1 hypothetical protein JFL75_05435 [Breznakiella homolactica]